MEPLVVTTNVEVALRFVVGVVAGVVATLVMDVVMARLPEGATPPRIAAGVLTDRLPGEAPARLATVVHYLAGVLTGPLFVWLLLASEGLLGDQAPLTTLVAALVLYLLMVGFFVVVVLPRSKVATDRVRAIGRDWAISAAAYLIILVALLSLAA